MLRCLASNPDSLRRSACRARLPFSPLVKNIDWHHAASGAFEAHELACRRANACLVIREYKLRNSGFVLVRSNQQQHAAFRLRMPFTTCVCLHAFGSLCCGAKWQTACLAGKRGAPLTWNVPLRSAQSVRTTPRKHGHSHVHLSIMNAASASRNVLMYCTGLCMFAIASPFGVHTCVSPFWHCYPQCGPGDARSLQVSLPACNVPVAAGFFTIANMAILLRLWR